MKTLFLFLTFSLFLFSCTKETLNEKIYGDWYFVEATETDQFDDEYDLLLDYENVLISFYDENNAFVWNQDNVDYEGDFSKGANKLTLNFNDGDKEVWSNFNIKNSGKTITYNRYVGDSYFKFKLERVHINYSRR